MIHSKNNSSATLQNERSYSHFELGRAHLSHLILSSQVLLPPAFELVQKLSERRLLNPRVESPVVGEPFDFRLALSEFSSELRIPRHGPNESDHVNTILL